LRFSAFENAEPDAQVGYLSLQPGGLCLGRQSPVMGELASLALDTVDEFADKNLE
jgi:hypothetical protein